MDFRPIYVQTQFRFNTSGIPIKFGYCGFLIWKEKIILQTKSRYNNIEAETFKHNLENWLKSIL